MMIPAAPSPLNRPAKRQSDTGLDGSKSFSVCVQELAHTCPSPHQCDLGRCSHLSGRSTRGKSSDSSGPPLCLVPPLFHIVPYPGRLPPPSKYAGALRGDKRVSKAEGLLRPFPCS